MTRTLRIGLAVLAAAVLFAAGFVTGQNKFGQPKTVIHVVAVKFKADSTPAQQQAALQGVLDVAAKMPGIKNVWIKSTRVQPQGYSAAFVIEFADRAAADAYAESPLRNDWFNKTYNPIREESRSFQITNP